MRKKTSRKEEAGLHPGQDLSTATLDFVPPGRHRVVRGRNKGMGKPLGCCLGCFCPQSLSFNCISSEQKSRLCVPRYSRAFAPGYGRVTLAFTEERPCREITNPPLWLLFDSRKSSGFLLQMPSVANIYPISDDWFRNRHAVNRTYE